MQNLPSSLDQLDLLVESFQFEEALNLCQEYLAVDQNADLYFYQGSILVELGRIEEAYNSFISSHSLNPNMPEVLMSLGQISEGEEAVDYFKRGIELLKQEGTGESETHLLRLSNALCSLAELYLTDCCDNESAEVDCEECIKEALKIAPNNPDVLVTAASFYLTTDNQQEAAQFLNQFYLQVSKEDPSNPSLWDATFETRLNAVRLMIESACPPSHPLELLERLEEDNEECIDVYYLQALIYFQSNEYDQAKEALEGAKALYLKLNLQDEEMVGAISHLDQQLLEKTDKMEQEEEVEEEEESSSSNE